MIAAMVSLALTLVVAEAAARFVFRVKQGRIYPPAMPWMELGPDGLRLVPNTHREQYAAMAGRAVRLDINADGFRGPELRPRAASVRRLLFLGDSIVFGPGLEYEETVPYLVGARLGSGVEVVNAAVPGMSLRDEVDLLEKKAGRLEPDLVVVGFYMNDPVRSYLLEQEYGGMDERLVSIITRLRGRSVLFNLLWERVLAMKLVSAESVATGWVRPFQERAWVSERGVYDEIIRLSSDDFGAAWLPSVWPGVAGQIQRLSRICAERHARPAVLIFPVSIQAESSVADDYPQQRMKELCKALGIPVLDLLPLLRAHAAEPVFIDQCHLNPRGSALAAADVARWIKEAQLMP
ncbi:MAG TPA: SGNH/GDSL hydrolase family protein [bacterium]|nr:SGNH/GDSL hydrolase family protein [bacterium]